MLSTEELTRYRRQLGIAEIGPEGQERLKAATVFVAGLGGLGSISTLYLTAAGIGGLRIVDRDRVALDNLNRQILYGTADLQRPKPEAARERLSALNPLCRIEAIQREITEESAADLVADSMLIVDATDNRQTRRILNRVSLARRIPFVLGGIEGFDGMVTTFVPGRTACFDCLFPGSPPAGPAPAVVGPLAGMVACIQVLEVLKYVLGFGTMLTGRLLTIRGADLGFRQTRTDRNPACATCGNQETL